MDLIGAHYRKNSFGPQFIDNFGVVYVSHLRAGVQIPQSVAEVAANGREISKHYLAAGDVVFFCTTGVMCPCNCGISLGGKSVVMSPREGWDIRMMNLDYSWFGNIVCCRRYW